MRLLAPLLLASAHAFSVPGLDGYMTALAVSPLETKVATAATLAVAGDAIAQSSDPETSYDKKRAASFVLFDAAYRGGFQHAAFPWIIDHCRGTTLAAASELVNLDSSVLPPADLLAAIECTAFNQLLVVPIVYYPLFFAITGAVQGLTIDGSLERARDRFVPLTLRNWAFWIPAQFVQFAFVDEPLQVPFTCAMGLVWNVILSSLAGSAAPAPVAEPLVGVVKPTGIVAGNRQRKQNQKEKQSSSARR